jgi:zinc protease
LPELSIWQEKLSNGLNVNGMNYSALPLVSFSVTIKGGTLLDNVNKPGVASLNAQLMNEGTALRTAEQLQDDLAALGASVSIYAGTESTVINGSALSRNFPEVLKIVQEMITMPRFDEEKFALRKESVLASLRQGEMQPAFVAQTATYKLIYGKESILGYLPQGTIESVNSITIDDIKAYYAKAISPAGASFAFVGNLSNTQLMKLLAPLAENWKGNAVEIPAIDNTQKTYPSRLFFVDFPNAPQSFILISKTTGAPMAHPDYYPMVIANYGVGASTSSELFMVLRQQYGYTYGAYSFVGAANYNNRFMAQSNVQSSATKHSLELFKEIITDYPNKILDADKLESNRNTMLLETTSAYEIPMQLLSVLNNISLNGMPVNYVKQQENILRNITLQQLRDIYSKYIDENDLIYVVVGDASRQLRGLESLGLGAPILVDKQGNILGR